LSIFHKRLLTYLLTSCPVRQRAAYIATDVQKCRYDGTICDATPRTPRREIWSRTIPCDVNRIPVVDTVAMVFIEHLESWTALYVDLVDKVIRRLHKHLLKDASRSMMWWGQRIRLAGHHRCDVQVYINIVHPT
jgi:hypothetical protein